MGPLETLSLYQRALESAVNVNSPVFASAAVVAGVVAFHEAGHFFAARWQRMKVQSFNIGYGPKLLSWNDTQSTEFNLRALPLGGYVSFPVNVEMSDKGEILKELDDPDLLQNRPPWQRVWVISGGVIANIVLSILLTSGAAFTTGLSKPVYDNGIAISQVLKTDTLSPGYMAGLQSRDVIRKVQGVPITPSELAVENFIREIRLNANKEVFLEIEREGKVIEKTVVPRSSRPDGQGPGTIGISVVPSILESKFIKATNPLEAIVIGIDETWHILFLTANALFRVVQQGPTGNEIGGPISVVKAGASMAEVSPLALVSFASNLSINLAILNSLPFPALDGGQLAFVLLEIARGKPVNRNVQEVVTSFAFLVLLLVGGYTIVGDILK